MESTNSDTCQLNNSVRLDENAKTITIRIGRTPAQPSDNEPVPTRFICPHCQRLLSVAKRKVGHAVACPQCGGGVIVPAPTAPLPSEDVSNGTQGSWFGPVFAPNPPSPKGQVDDGSSESKSVSEDGNGQRIVDAWSHVAAADARAVSGGPREGAMGIGSLPPPADYGPQEGPYPMRKILEDFTSHSRPELTQGAAEATRHMWHRGGMSELTVTLQTLYTIGGLLIGVALLAFLLGYTMGHESSRSKGSAELKTPRRIHGQLTYMTRSGNIVADSEAVVVVVPVGREPDEKLAIESLRPESPPPKNLDRSVQGIRATGGDIARTDAKGSYDVEVPQAGEYYLLLLSAHATRDNNAPPTTTEIAQLARYFQRPDDLLGSNAYIWSKLIVRNSVQQDHMF